MPTEELDIAGNRSAAKYAPAVLIRRLLWALVSPSFRFSPRICFGWRSFLLRAFGAKVGRNVHIYNTANIYMPWNLSIGDWSSVGEWALVYNLGPVTIGSKTTISQRAHLCAGTHDFCDPALPLLKSPIVVGDQAWVCADAFVGPRVVVGEGAIVGARAVAVKDVEPWTIVAGNPARPIRRRVLKGAS